ncbi:MAG: InlB B-repeat-containing protein [Muribaculaceae bacterium]|nr:InlB B-repeat-containing protein [Muribaculaceae bacterium]
MNKMRNILLMGVLSVSLIVISLPVELLAREPEEVQEEDQSGGTLKEVEEDLQEEQPSFFEITAFEELPEDVCRQHVLLGTSIEELNLPDTLTVSGGYAPKEAEDNSDKPEEKESGIEEGCEGEEPETPDEPDTEEGTEEKEPDKPEEEESGIEEGCEGEEPETPDEPDTEESPEEEEPDKPEEEESGIEEGCEEEEPETPDEPDTEEGFEEEDNGAAKRETLAIKTVRIPMRQYYAHPQYAMTADVLVSEDTEGAVMETKVIEEVLWTSMPAYDGETEGVYFFTPILPEGYRIKDSVSLPEISLFVGGEELALDRETGMGNRIIIDRDTEWNRETILENCTVVIEEGVTLKILSDRVLVTGNVVIEGGGKIVTGPAGNSGSYFIYVDTDGVLTMRNITVDGQNQENRLPIVDSWGKVILGAGCKIINCHAKSLGSFRAEAGSNMEINGAEIRNCTAEGYGGFLYGTGAEIVIDGATVNECKAADGGGFFAVENTHITINDIDIRDCEAEQGGAFYLKESCKVEMNGGTIRNCKADRGGAFYARQGTFMEIYDVTINGCLADDSGGALCMYTAYVGANDSYLSIHRAVIEDCSAKNSGGAIAIYAAMSLEPLLHPNEALPEVFVTIEDGLFHNNSTSAAPNASVEQGGGCIYNEEGNVSIKGGQFIGNTAANMGGCIFHSGYPTVTSLYGGTFEGNRCTGDAYQGSGAAYISSIKSSISYLYLSEGVLLNGDGIEGSGTDGIYLDSQTEPRRIWLRDTLNEPATVYVKAVEGYAIAEGADGYILSESKDIPKVKFINIGSDPGPWYSVLDEEKNQIRLSKTKPQYKVTVHYDSNGAEGTIEDDDNNGAGYMKGDTVTVRSAESLSLKGHHFIGWNTKADGKGAYYYAGNTIDITEEITSDIYLYAIFEKNKSSKKTNIEESGTKIGEFKAYVQAVPEVSKERLEEYPQSYPVDNEPDTGDDSTRMEVYIITALVAWVYYLLLRMTTGQNGMTEEEKQEMTSCIIGWGRKGKKGRRLLALAAVCWITFFYYSIGKKTDTGWMEVYGE